MKLKTIECPNCGAKLEEKDGLDTFYCTYCGYRIVLEGQSDAAYKAKTKIKEMEHEEKMFDKKVDLEEKKELEKYNMETLKSKRNFWETMIKENGAMLIIIAMIVFYGGYMGLEKRASKQEEQELQALVEEIQIDIKNEDYASAYIKAQSIKYTSGWSSDAEEKWDNVRKEAIEQIEEAERKSAEASGNVSEQEIELESDSSSDDNDKSWWEFWK